MSKRKLREEKNCLNCGHEVPEQFCTHCGQENLVIHDSAWHLMIHYVQDLFHYDGRFWHTITNLFKSPGTVALEFIQGKRRSNIEPIKLYVFTSSVFFLLFFIAFEKVEVNKSNPEIDQYRERLQWLEAEKKLRAGSDDTMMINVLQQPLRIRLDSLGEPHSEDTNNLDFSWSEPDAIGMDTATGFFDWVGNRISAKMDRLTEEHGGDQMKANNALLNEVFHKLPQLLFLSMPFFALLLHVLYINRRERNYAEHFIFSIYHYSFLFIVMIIFNLASHAVGLLPEQIGESTLNILFIGTWIYMIVYLFISMRRFYGGRRLTLLIRYIILAFLFCILLLVLGVLVAVVTAMF